MNFKTNKVTNSLMQKAKRLSPRGSPFKTKISIINNDETIQKRTITVLPPKPYYTGDVGFRFGAFSHT